MWWYERSGELLELMAMPISVPLGSTTHKVSIRLVTREFQLLRLCQLAKLQTPLRHQMLDSWNPYY